MNDPIPPSDGNALPEEIATLINLGSPAAFKDLERLSFSTDRRIRKAARRGLFILQQRGLQPESLSEDNSILVDARRTEPKSETPAIALLTLERPAGDRMCVVSQDETTTSSWTVLLSASRGIVSINNTDMSIADARRLLTKPTPSGHIWPVCRLQGTQVAQILYRYLDINESARTMIPFGTRRLLARFAPIKPDSHLEAPTPPTISSPLLATDAGTAQAHLESIPVWSLGLGSEAIAQARQDHSRFEMSRVILLPSTQRQREEAFWRELVDRLITSEAHQRVIHQLEDDAVVYYHSGDHGRASQLMEQVSAGRRSAVPSEWPLLQAVVRATVATDSIGQGNTEAPSGPSASRHLRG